jgi:thioredoxin-related protein
MFRLIFLTLSIFLTFSLSYAEDKKVGKFLGGKTAPMPSWFLNSFLDLNEDVEDLSSIDKRLMLFIHQDNCPYCHKFITKNLSNEKIKQKVQKHFGVVDINMFGSKDLVSTNEDELTEKEFALKYKVQFTPTIIFFDEEGKQVLRLNGYINEKNFELALDYIKDKKEKHISFKEYVNQGKDKIKLDLHKSELLKETNNFIRKPNSKKMAIFFESNDCKDCEILHKKLLKDETTQALLKTMDLYQVDMNMDKSIVTPNKMILKIKDWAKKLNINHKPTIIFFDENAKEIIRVESSFKNFHFQTIVDYVVSNSHKEEKEFQRYLTKRANDIRHKGIDVNIWK